MTLQITGKISLQSPICEKCGENIMLWAYSENISCTECGAVYHVSKSELKDQYMEYEFDFVEFQCIQKSITESCQNVCPAPSMFCKEHTSDESFKEAKNAIQYAMNRVATTKEKLKKMEESKKIHLIQKVSGIDG
ncbi:hypothetical protein LCGC14_1840890 [marine sediment metagenome]|uniref:Uncharacterized protein n=1 Tax=marine sediment metagenome TaxID=412755 RepID=A0A0F9ISS2_9ZZZZ